jgi:hypothetical protein
MIVFEAVMVTLGAHLKERLSVDTENAGAQAQMKSAARPDGP